MGPYYHPGQSGPESNSNESILHSPQISRTGASTSDLYKRVFKSLSLQSDEGTQLLYQHDEQLSTMEDPEISSI